MEVLKTLKRELPCDPDPEFYYSTSLYTQKKKKVGSKIYTQLHRRLYVIVKTWKQPVIINRWPYKKPKTIADACNRNSQLKKRNSDTQH